MGARPLDHITDVHGPYPPDMRIINPYSVAAGDPLSGISFHVRLQTHNGNNVPLGLYQDTSCTTPAANNSDPVAAWRDELSGGTIVFSNGTSGERPTLTFVSGVPVVTFDGSNDVLVQQGGTISPAFIAACVDYVSDGGVGRVTTGQGSGNGGFYASGGNWTARYSSDNIALGASTSGYDRLFIQGGAGTSRVGLNGSNTNQSDSTITSALFAVGDYQSGGGQVIGMNLVALYFGSAAINTTEQSAMESYMLSLAP